MSEDQYYEFRAVDHTLTTREIGELRGHLQSSRHLLPIVQQLLRLATCKRTRPRC